MYNISERRSAKCICNAQDFRLQLSIAKLGKSREVNPGSVFISVLLNEAAPFFFFNFFFFESKFMLEGKGFN